MLARRSSKRIYTSIRRALQHDGIAQRLTSPIGKLRRETIG